MEKTREMLGSFALITSLFVAVAGIPTWMLWYVTMKMGN